MHVFQKSLKKSFQHDLKKYIFKIQVLKKNIALIFLFLSFTFENIQVTATDGDKDRPQNIVYFLTGQGIDPDNPANSKFDINRTTGEIFVLKVSFVFVFVYFIFYRV